MDGRFGVGVEVDVVEVPEGEGVAEDLATESGGELVGLTDEGVVR